MSTPGQQGGQQGASATTGTAAGGNGGNQANQNIQNTQNTQSAQVLKRISSDPNRDTDIVQVAANVFTYRLPFKRLPLVNIGARCTFGKYCYMYSLLYIYTYVLDFGPRVLKITAISNGCESTTVLMQSGSIAVFSPLPLTQKVRNELNRLGNAVRYIIALNLDHHMFLHEWKIAYPDAVVVGPTGLQDKINQKPDAEYVVVDSPMHEGVSSHFLGAPFRDDFSFEYFYMLRTRDIVFMHGPSGSLIEADLFYNASRRAAIKEGPPKQAYACSVMKAPKWGQRVAWFFRGRHNRGRYDTLVGLVGTWRFDRVIPCHGDIISPGGKRAFIAELRKGVPPLRK